VNDLRALKVVPFTHRRVPNPYPGGELPWQVYHTVRNAIVRACRKHGPTGPMGEVRITAGADSVGDQRIEDPESWEPGDRDPTYYIIDDQYNDERYLYTELYGDDPFNAGWLLSVTAVLQQYKGWGLGINNIPDSYVLIFGRRLMVKGRQLARCRSALEVVQAVGRLLRRGDRKWWQFWK
jgi:hypothetical protein